MNIGEQKLGIKYQPKFFTPTKSGCKVGIRLEFVYSVELTYIYVLLKNHSSTYYTFCFIDILVKKISDYFELFSKKILE